MCVEWKMQAGEIITSDVLHEEVGASTAILQLYCHPEIADEMIGVNARVSSAFLSASHDSG
jgi:hypothetical protein